jgi:hypothetical protein
VSYAKRRDRTARLSGGILVVFLTLALPTWVGASPAQRVSYQAAATLTGPVTVGQISEPLTALPTDLTAYNYVEQEFFASGTAMTFKADTMPSNGRWTITPTTTASYKTRIIVRRPANPARFNGTVVVEWMNESAGESAPDWDLLNPLLKQDGYAYVAVSAQSLGVDGGTSILGTSTSSKITGLVTKEPARYGSLHQPGDQYALDIFAQIGEALRAPDKALGPLKPKRLIAVGESQSAFYMTTFADALQPLTNIFSGIFIHSRGSGAASLNGSSITSASPIPKNLRIRTDLKIPVFMFETQTDLIQLGYAVAQQPNTNKIRTWEVAGTSHADAYLVNGDASLLGCTTPINTGPQHEVVQAAFAALNKWVVDGIQPPSPAPFRLSSEDPPTLALDKNGNVIGGVRTPAVQVPISTLSGATPPGASSICSLFGSTTPFSQSELISLYGSPANYLKKYTSSLNKAIASGFILPADRAELLARAQQVQF